MSELHPVDGKGSTPKTEEDKQGDDEVDKRGHREGSPVEKKPAKIPLDNVTSSQRLIFTANGDEAVEIPSTLVEASETLRDLLEDDGKIVLPEDRKLEEWRDIETCIATQNYSLITNANASVISDWAIYLRLNNLYDQCTSFLDKKATYLSGGGELPKETGPQAPPPPPPPYYQQHYSPYPPPPPGHPYAAYHHYVPPPPPAGGSPESPAGENSAPPYPYPGYWGPPPPPPPPPPQSYTSPNSPVSASDEHYGYPPYPPPPPYGQPHYYGAPHPYYSPHGPVPPPPPHFGGGYSYSSPESPYGDGYDASPPGYHHHHPGEEADYLSSPSSTHGSNMVNSSGSHSRNLKIYVKPTMSSMPGHAIERQQRKNAQARLRAEKHRALIETLQSKPKSEITPEEASILKMHEQRRSRKNNRSKARAQEQKEEMERILNIPEKKRTPLQVKWLQAYLEKKAHKNRGDRDRRKKQKAGIFVRGRAAPPSSSLPFRMQHTNQSGMPPTPVSPPTKSNVAPGSSDEVTV